MPKKNSTVGFIQDLQPVNKVTIQNVVVELIIDEFTEAFTRRSICSVSKLFSRYDKFQLAIESTVSRSFASTCWILGGTAGVLD